MGKKLENVLNVLGCTLATVGFSTTCYNTFTHGVDDPEPYIGVATSYIVGCIGVSAFLASTMLGKWREFLRQEVERDNYLRPFGEEEIILGGYWIRQHADKESDFDDSR